MFKINKKISLIVLVVIVITLSFLYSQKVLAVSIDLNINTGLGTASVTEIISRIIQIFLGLLGVIALSFILYGGFIWMTAAGNQEKIAKAKKILINAAIGLAIILSAFAIVTFLINAIVEGTTGPPVNTNQPPPPPPPPPPPSGFSVQWVNPANNATNVVICTIIQAGFNSNIDPTTINGNFELRECTNGQIANCIPSTTTIAGNLSATGLVLSFNPDNDLTMDSAFQATIKSNPITGGITNINNNTLNADYIWYFATGNQDDNDPPQVTTVYPANNATNVCLNTAIEAVFSESMAVSTLYTAGSFTLNGNNVTNQSNNGTTIFTWYPGTLNQNSSYEAILNSAIITDACDNNLDGDNSGIYEPGANPSPPPPNLDDYLWSFDTGTTLECTPEITDITDDGYYDGSDITISGSNFTNSYASYGDAVFNNNVAVYDDNYCFSLPMTTAQIPETSCLVGGGWSASQINIRVPAESGNSNGAITGPVHVEIPSQSGILSSNSVNFNVLSPHINDLYPENGGVGQAVTLWGTNFGDSEGEVWFINTGGQTIEADLPCEDTGWENDYIIMTVPTGLSIGEWQVQVKTNNNHWSNLGNFTVNTNPAGPVLCQLNPDNGEFEDLFNLVGEDFGTTQGEVLFGTNISAPIVNWNNTSINASVPNVAAGTVPVSVKDLDNLLSNALPFDVTVTPGTDFYISYITPTSGPENQYVTIYGNGFGNTKGNQTVYFGTVEGQFNFPSQCSTSYWTNNQIIVKVPAGAGNEVKVYRPSPDPQYTNGVAFTFQTTGSPTPGICSINPPTGQVGTEVEIAGEPFINPDVTEVNFYNNVPQTQINYLTNQLVRVDVPQGAQTGPVKVISAAGTSNPLNFEVTTGGPPPGGPFDYYEWQFTTCDNCLVPQVVELPCYNYNNQFYSSPSPYINSQNNFTNIDFAVKFNTEMDINSFSWGSSGTVRLKQCGSGQNFDPQSCTTNSSIGLGTQGMTLDENGEWLAIDLDDTLSNNTWYQVELTGGIESLEGWQLANGNGYNNWYFKTQTTGEECVADTVNVIPGPNSYAIIGNTIDYQASAVNSYSCNICDNSLFEWSWESGDPTQAQILSSNYNQSTVEALAVANPVQITATADPIAVGPTVDGYSDLYITDGGQGSSCDSSPLPACQPDNSLCNQNLYCEPQSCTCQPIPYPVVIAYGPACNYACGNTGIFATFNMQMDQSTLNNSTIDILPCTDEGCTTFGIEIDWSMQIDPNFYNGTSGYRININPLDNLPLSKYRVILKDDIQSPAGDNLGNLNYPPANPDSFSWTFQVTTPICELDSVVVSPPQHVFTQLNVEYPYTAFPYSNDNCPNTPLNSSLIDSWSWAKEPPDTDVITVVNVNSNQTKVISLNEGGPVYVRATATEGNIFMTNQGENGRVFVSLQGPQVLNQCIYGIDSPSPEPASPDVCINAAVSARFDSIMDWQSIIDNVTIKECSDGQENCTTNISGDFVELVAELFAVDGFVFYPDDNFVQNTWYEVTIPINVTDITGIPMDQEFKWQFKTRDNTSVCEPQIVTVAPNEAVILLTGPGSQAYTAVAQPEACGYIISDERDWSWSSTAQSVATVSPPNNSQTPQGQTIATAAGLGETDIQSTTSGITGSGHLIVSNYPEVESTIPPDGAPNVCRNTEISATFDQLMNTQTLNSNTIQVKQKLYFTGNQTVPPGCEQIGGGEIGYNNLIRRPLVFIKDYLNQLVNKLSLILFDKEFNLLEKATAQLAGQPYWCPVSGTFSYENINLGSQTKVYFNPFYLLNANTNFQIKILGGDNGVKNIYNFPMQEDYGYDDWNFTTGPEICTLNYIKLYADYTNASNNTTSWLFTTNVNNSLDDNPGNPLYDTVNDADKVYLAKAYSIGGQLIQGYQGVYQWIWKDWASDNTIIAELDDPTGNAENEQTVIAMGQNGIANIFVTASTTPSSLPIYGSALLTTSATAEVDMCENPWIDYINPPDPPTNVPYTYLSGYFQEDDYSFKLKYCRDAGSEGTADDLPTLDYSPICKSTGSNSCLDLLGISPGEDGLLQEYVFAIYDLEPPTNLTASLGAIVPNIGQEVNLSWTGVDDPNATYEVERAQNATFTLYNATVCSGSNTQCIDTVMNSSQINQNYYYHVRVIYDNGNSSWSNIVNVTITPNQQQ